MVSSNKTTIENLKPQGLKTVISQIKFILFATLHSKYLCRSVRAVVA